MRALKSYGLAVVLVVLVALWLGTGLLVRGGKGPVLGEITVVSALEKDGGVITDAVEATGIAKTPHHETGAEDPALSIAERNALLASSDGPARSVRVKTYKVQPMALEVTLRGHTAAKASVDAVARTGDYVRQMAVTEGQKVAEGDLICALDSGTRQASVDQARAVLAQSQAALLQARTAYNTNESLRKKDLASANSSESFAASLKAAEANFEAASVALRNREVELEYTRIRATVPGVIQRPLAEVGDFLNPGKSCATIVQLDPMVFVGAVPQANISHAHIGLDAKIRTINGETAEGKVSFIAVSANPATRAFDVEIEFPNPDGRILDGLTAEAEVKLGEIPAHLLPQSNMTLDQHGTLGVRAVEDSKVVFYPIRILRDTRDGIWVTGLPQSVDIIVVGQEYVIAGQTVTADFAE